jgi:universal stress protein A
MKIKPTSKSGQVVVQLGWQDDHLLDESVRKAAAAPFRLRKILVPIDFSECSRKALIYALRFAQQFGGQLLLVHVVEPMIVPENMLMAVPELPEAGGNLVNEAQARLTQLAKKEVPAEIKVDVIVRVGRPYYEVIEAAKAEDVDLIVIATHGYTGLKHVFLGSTAERVVRHASCPVLTVREPVSDSGN